MILSEGQLDVGGQFTVLEQGNTSYILTTSSSKYKPVRIPGRHSVDDHGNNAV